MTGATYLSRPAETKPAAKATSLSSPSYTDSRFGTKIFKATDYDTDYPPPGSRKLIRHEYSRHQAYNCDDTRYIAQAYGGAWWLYDAATFARIDGGAPGGSSWPGALGLAAGGWLFAGDCEPVWHPTDPDLIWAMNQDGVNRIVYEFNITTKTRTTLFDLTSHISALGWSGVTYMNFQGEGRPSNDGRWWALSCQNSSFNYIGFFMYDRQTDTIVRSWATTNKPNNITTSPSGKYAVVAWSTGSNLTLSQAAAAAIGSTNGTRAYDKDTGGFTQLSCYGEHADTAVDNLGNDVYVSIHYNIAKTPDVTEGEVHYRRCDDGVAHGLGVFSYQNDSHAWHFSGCCYDRPGWVAASAYAGSPGSAWKDETVLAIELKASGNSVRRLAHHQSVPEIPDVDNSPYWYEPQVTVNRDFTRLMFASNFRVSSNDFLVESYMIGLPSTALD